MIHKLWIRIILSFLLLMSSLLVITGLFLAEMMKDKYYELKEDQLLESAQLSLNSINKDKLLDDHEQLQSEVKKLNKSIETRITIINKDGVVLADSEDEPSKMANHAKRPEVQQVIVDHHSKGLSTRYSETLGYSMMYMTIPIEQDGDVIGLMRTSLSLKQIEEAIQQLWQGIIIVLCLAFILTGIIGIRLAKGISGPIEEMIEVSDKLKEKNYNARVKKTPSGELGQLANAINVLASSLKSQMERLQENEQRLSGVLSNMMNGVLVVNPKGRVLVANRALGEMLGENPDSIVYKRHLEVVRNVELSSAIEDCLRSGKEMRKEIHLYYPNERILDAHLAPYVKEKDEMKGIIAVLHDVTDIRRLEKMRSEFVANVSHELKTPITSVKGFAETLLDGAMNDPELCQTFLKIIYDESERLHRLISDILDLSSIEQHRIPLKVENVNMLEAVLDTANTLKKETTKKQLTLKLPRLEEDVWIEGEKDRIQQIVLNLLSNAIAYTSEGGRITIALEEDEQFVDLRISDTGIGISKKDVQRIFERFYRVEKARSRSSGGTGLGLAIVKHLVESHHGEIHVDSIEGEGTIFTVRFPKKQ